MERNEVLENVFKQAREIVPNKEICEIATVDEFFHIMKEIDCDAIDEFLSKENLNISANEIPTDIKFEVIMLLIYVSEPWHFNCWAKKIWNLDDSETMEMLNQFQKWLGV